MPDLPPQHLPLPSTASTASLVHETHSFTTRTFTKIHLFGGPFNVKLFHNKNAKDNYTSVDVEIEKSIQNLLTIDVTPNGILLIRMIENPQLNSTTNTTLLISYQQLEELHIDGMTNVQCINRIEGKSFQLHSRGTGSVKLKVDVSVLDAYLHSIGYIKICGQVTNEAVIKSLGVGDIECRNLLAKKIHVISSGIGNIHIVAIDEINITSSGIGTVYYSGPLKHQIKTGLGDIVQLPNISLSNDRQLISDDLD